MRILLLLSLSLAFAVRAEVTVVDRPDTNGKFDHYVANRAPLQPSPFVKLPIGSVRAQGWLKKVLQFQADGFHGHLTEISGFLKKDDNAWLSPEGKGDHGWEEVPYWLKGFIACAYELDDKRMCDEAKIWIEGAISNQQPDGWIGPGKGRKGIATNLTGREDLWPNMLMMYCLQTYFEKTGDKRVLDAMTKYFKYLAAQPDKNFLTSWAASRGGDQLYSVLWLYNITGEPWLLDLARKTHRATLPWENGVANWHNVNLAQGFREPTEFWQLTGDAKHRVAADRNWNEAREKYGQVPGGMFGADENARPGYNGPRQAIETCGIAEEMLSDEILLAVTGDEIWAERCEDAAFNSMPAALTADLKALRYLTAPNQPQSDHVSKSPGVQNGGPMFCMNPHDHRCCQHNCGMAWPFFTGNLWLAAPDNGIAAILYGPSEVIAKVGDGVVAKITETTKYPFEDRIAIEVSVPRKVAFPMYLRIPLWAAKAKLAINGKAQDTAFPAGKLVKISREWRDGDHVELSLPMEIAVKKWTENHGTVSVRRGPLTYSLQIKENYVRHGGTDAWPAWDILPASSWNYGLVPESANSFEFQSSPWPADDQPWRNDAAPVKILAKARKIPAWTLDPKGCIHEVVDGPIRTAEPVETVTLIPMGAARLRISAFPIASDAADARAWPEPPAPGFKVTASHCFDGDTVDAIADGILPKNSNDHSIPRFTWWDHRGTTEWINAEFGKPRNVSSVKVYWFDDSPRGGNCRAPKAWRLLYRSNGVWKPVANASGFGTALDTFNVTEFDAVLADGLIIEADLQEKLSAGILELIAE